MLFHAFPDLVPGGYVGVDIFFVISGFLITGILLKEVQQGRFSILGFYVRRARRLFPALSVVLLAVLLFGWFSLLPGEYALQGKHVLAGAGFVSNIVFWREAGYFDVNSELKPLLHLWSLGVEEQYYLVWPLLVFLLARKMKVALWATLSLAVASFALNAVLIGPQPALTFFLPVTRFWELLVGGLLAFLKDRPWPNRQRQAFSLGGVLLIAAALFLYDRQTWFPGWAASLPVAGTALVIAAGPAVWLNQRLLSNQPVVWVGLISYPLYLWHWPLFAYARLVQGGTMSAGVGASLSLLAIGLAWLTYRFIEQPFRRPIPAAVARREAGRLWLATIALGISGLVAWLAWLEPRSAANDMVRAVSAAQADWHDVANGRMAGDSPERVLFIGDSHMQQYLPRIEALVKARRAPVYTVEFKTESGCAPLRGIERRSGACSPFVTEAFAMAGDPAVRTVIIASSWYGFSTRDDYYRLDADTRQPIRPFAAGNRWIFDRWADDIRQLVQAGKRVVIIASSPRGPLADPMRRIDRGLFSWRVAPMVPSSRTELYAVVADVDLQIRESARDGGAEIVDPFDWLCDAETCALATGEGVPIYMDKTHLRASFVRDNLAMLDRYVYVSD